MDNSLTQCILNDEVDANFQSLSKLKIKDALERSKLNPRFLPVLLELEMISFFETNPSSTFNLQTISTKISKFWDLH